MRIRRSRKKRLTPFTLLLVLALFAVWKIDPAFFDAITGNTRDSPESGLVTKAIDGDTLQLADGDKVRLIGVDTPETVHPQKPVEYFGKEASAFTRRMVEGKRVRLEFDRQKRDKYGRRLAYVYLEDGTFLNAELIKQGYGFAYTAFPFRYLDEFRGYQQEARERKLGLWAEE